MSLANLQIRSETVEYNGTNIVLRGLSANAIAGLIISNLSSLEELFDIAEKMGVKGADDLARVNVVDIGVRMLAQVPDFMASAIAHAAGEPQYAHVIKEVDGPTQLKMLKAVASLTFNDEAGFREFAGNVVAALRSAKGVVPQPKQNPGVNVLQNGGSA
jgi:hypothetical protein